DWTIRIAALWSGTGPVKLDSCSPAVMEASPLSCPTRSTIPEASTAPSAGSSSRHFSEEEPELMTRMRAEVGSAMACAPGAVGGRGAASGRAGGVGRRLDRAEDHGVDDVVHQGAAREVADRPVQALQDGAARDRARGALDGLLDVVAGVEVREDEH